MASNIPDLIIDSKLQIEVFADRTIETTYISNPAAGQRRTLQQRTWQRTEKLGQGTFGVVWLEKCVAGFSSGDLRAVKELRKGTINEFPTYYGELEAIAKFSQERYRDHFVRSFGWFENDSAVFITMEYLQFGDLEGHLTTCLNHIEARQIAQQLLEGLEFMHSNNFAHRDLEPKNILVLHRGPDWWIKIADFGITKRLDDTALRTKIGTEDYLAPEVRGIYTTESTEYDDNIFSLAVDIWAVGAITFRMVTGRLAFPSRRQLFNYVVYGHAFPVADSVRQECTDFIVKAMAASPRHRPTPQQGLSHQWIQIQEPVLNYLDTNPITCTSHNHGSRETTASIASNQWSTLSGNLATMYPGNHIPPSNLINDSLLNNQTIKDQQGRFQQVQKLEGHHDWIYTVAFAPNGRQLASSGNIGIICIWEADQQGRFQQMQALEGHHDWIKTVVFAPNGRQLASGGENGIICIREVDQQGRFQQMQVLEGHHDWINTVAFAPNGRQLASGGGNGIIYIWEVDQQGRFQQIQKLEGHQGWIETIDFAPGGHQLASGGSDNVIRIWEAEE